jgi:hypothetical protein
MTFPESYGTHTMFPDGAKTDPQHNPDTAVAIGPIFEKEYETGLNIPTFAEWFGVKATFPFGKRHAPKN